MTFPPVLGAIAAIVIGTTWSTSGRAAEDSAPSPSGPRIGLRSGFALPIGRAYANGTELSETISGYIPIRLDIGYRVRRYFYFGADGQLATIVPSGCVGATACGGTDARFGAIVAAHLRPQSKFDPWLGVGVGFERLDAARSSAVASVALSAQGVELLDAEIGADLRGPQGLRVGPVVSLAMSRYTSVAINGASSNDFDATVHEWVMVGLRAAYDL